MTLYTLHIHKKNSIKNKEFKILNNFFYLSMCNRYTLCNRYKLSLKFIRIFH